MMSFKFVAFTILAFIVVFATLPTATHCDSSYYEKYYAARRFLPLKRTSLLQHNFTVEFPKTDQVRDFESVALIGNIKQLGAWAPEAAIMMNRSTSEHNVWTATVQLPANTSVSYRYFIAALDKETGTLQIQRWESSLQARAFNTTTVARQVDTDIFGRIQQQQSPEIQRGWLHRNGRIIQFKLFRNPIKFVENRPANEHIYVKLQPVEPQMLTPIMPSACANAEYVRMRYGDSFIRPQEEFGVPYENNDILIFHTTVAELKSVVYLLKLYRKQEGSDLVNLLGYQYVYPDVLEGSEGKFSVNLISPTWLNVIATIDVRYLVIAPLPNATVDFRTSFVDYWRSNWTQLDVGHRGLGKSLKQSSNAPAIIENTVASMKASGELGAEMVEFDVMLTKDLVPIIYHDYSIYVCIESKTPTSILDLTRVLIKDVTYEQLKSLTTYQVVGTKIVEYPAHNNVERVDHRLFPLFEEFLTQVNHSVGFDIEIKWPQLTRLGVHESEQTIDKNLYIDRILDVMLRHGCGRLSFFTSFDADICSLLRFKQNMYPVMFLSSTPSTYADPRSDTLYDSINNAQAFDLMGIVPNAAFIKSDPNWIQIAHRQQKKVFLWGDNLKDVDSIAWYKNTGPEGVIYDRLDLWLPEDKLNALELESDLPEFLKLQCPPQAGSEGNKTIESILSNVNLF